MNLFGKIVTFTSGVFFCGLGIAFSTQAGLGTTPISSLPYVLTFMTPLSFGTTTFLINMLFILGQKIILGKNFKPVQYLQIIVTLCFGFFIDFGMFLSQAFKTSDYFSQILMLIIGSAILSFGVTLETKADIMYVPGEGIVRAISKKTGKPFGKIKIYFDFAQCIAAILLSIVVLNKIEGLREGTLIAAFLTGYFVLIYTKIISRISRCLKK